MIVPLYGFLEGDTMGLVVLARPEDTIAELAERLRRSASLRVEASRAFRVLKSGVEVPLDLTVQAAGFSALDRFDVVREVGV